MAQRTFTNPQGDGGTTVLVVGLDYDVHSVAPGESVTLDWPDEQPAPELLVEDASSDAPPSAEAPAQAPPSPPSAPEPLEPAAVTEEADHAAAQ